MTEREELERLRRLRELEERERATTPRKTLTEVRKQLQREGGLLPRAEGEAISRKLGRQIGLTARAGYEGVMAIPGMIADAPFRVARALGADVPVPTERQGRMLSAIGLPEPATDTERIAGAGASAMAGTGGTIKLADMARSLVTSPAVQQTLSRLGMQPGMQVASAGAGGTSAQTAEERGAGPIGTMTAGLAGAMAPYALSQVGGRVLRPVGSFKSTEQKVLIDQAKRMGFKLTAGQETGNERLMAAESTMRRIPGGGEIQKLGTQNKRVLGAQALRTIGEQGDAVTPDVLSRADARIGNQFERVTKNATIRLGDDFVDDLARIEQEYVQVWNQSDQMGKVIDRAMNAATKGAISGEEYQRIRSALQREAVSKIKSGDANTGNALADLAEVLDDAAQKSIPEKLSNVLRDARKQWRNLLVLYDATTANITGKSGAGDLDPNALMNAVIKNRGRRVFAKTPLGGGDELADLARISTSIRDLIPSSGTAERMYWMSILGGGAGTVGGALIGGAPGAVIGQAAGVATPYLTTRAMMSDPLQAYLKHGYAPGAAQTLVNQRVPLSAIGSVTAEQNR